MRDVWAGEPVATDPLPTFVRTRRLGARRLREAGLRPSCGPLAQLASAFCLPPFPLFRSSVRVKAAWLKLTGSYAVPILGVLDCPKRGGDADGTHF